MDPVPPPPVGLLQSSEGPLLQSQGLQDAASSPCLTQQVSEHFIHCQWKRPSSAEVSSCQAPFQCSCVHKCMQGGRQGETHLKVSQHLESSCWPAYSTPRSAGPVGTQIGRDEVRKRRGDRHLQKSWLDAHRFVLPSTVLPGLPFSSLAARAGYCPREAPGSAL